jgi:hypothetical protein
MVNNRPSSLPLAALETRRCVRLVYDYVREPSENEREPLLNVGNQAFPPGCDVTLKRNPDGSYASFGGHDVPATNRYFWSWLALILPFAEQDDRTARLQTFRKRMSP